MILVTGTIVVAPGLLTPPAPINGAPARGYTSVDVCHVATIALGAEYPGQLCDSVYSPEGAWSTDPYGCGLCVSSVYLCMSYSVCSGSCVNSDGSKGCICSSQA